MGRLCSGTMMLECKMSNYVQVYNNRQSHISDEGKMRLQDSAARSLTARCPAPLLS